MERLNYSSKGKGEGINRTESGEKSLGEQLLKIIPSDYSINIYFDRGYFMDADIIYKINKNKKIISITYCQNIDYYSKDVIKEITEYFKTEKKEN